MSGRGSVWAKNPYSITLSAWASNAYFAVPKFEDLHVYCGSSAPDLGYAATHASLGFRIIRGRGHEHADAPHPLGLLRACRKRPCRRAAEQRDELTSLSDHLIGGLQARLGQDVR
jgi:hypothetical protein